MCVWILYQPWHVFYIHWFLCCRSTDSGWRWYPCRSSTQTEAICQSVVWFLWLAVSQHFCWWCMICIVIKATSTIVNQYQPSSMINHDETQPLSNTHQSQQWSTIHSQWYWVPCDFSLPSHQWELLVIIVYHPFTTVPFYKPWIWVVHLPHQPVINHDFPSIVDHFDASMNQSHEPITINYHPAAI